VKTHNLTTFKKRYLVLEEFLNELSINFTVLLSASLSLSEYLGKRKLISLYLILEDRVCPVNCVRIFFVLHLFQELVQNIELIFLFLSFPVLPKVFINFIIAKSRKVSSLGEKELKREGILKIDGWAITDFVFILSIILNMN
jgi:hypothetical protein